MSKAIKITLDDRDFARFAAIMDDMNIPTFAIMARKFILDGMKAYRQKNRHLLERELMLTGKEPNA